jgi:hypothetical protein
MSNGDDEPAPAEEGSDEPASDEPASDKGESTEPAPEEPESDDSKTDTAASEEADEEGANGEETAIENTDEHTVETLEDRLDSTAEEIEQAGTEAELDRAETALDEIEADIDAGDLLEHEADDEEADDPREELESQLAELRTTVEEKRGPYAADVIEEIESAAGTIEDTRWTERGEQEVAAAVSTFLNSAGDALGESFAAESDAHEELRAALEAVIETVETADLDPDEDEATIAALFEASEELTRDIDDAEAWDDLTVREKLDAEGFYDVLTPENRRDFPPEWNAIKLYERQGDPEPILRGLEMFGSDFMEEHCIDALARMGAPEAFEVIHERAEKRNTPAIRVLGKIGDGRAVDTLHEYVAGENDPKLQQATLKALGEIGSRESTQAVADRLVADNEEVRSRAARALGLIGDTRAIEPLGDVLGGGEEREDGLEEDDSDRVRASAAWALGQIGTEHALEVASEHTDDRSYLVQAESETAAAALEDGAASGDATTDGDADGGGGTAESTG